MNVFVFVMKNRLEYRELCKIYRVIELKVFMIRAYNFDMIRTIEDKNCWVNEGIIRKMIIFE